MTALTLQTIEDALIARVAAASAAEVLGYTVRTVATYGDELDEGLTRAVRQFPAVWFVLARARDIERGIGLYETELTWSAVVATRSLRGEGARRRGAGGEPGAYDLALDVRGLLAGQTLGLDIARLAPGAWTNLMGPQTEKLKIAAYAIEFTTRAQLAVPAEATALDDFTDFRASWDLAPEPDDVHEAEDRVTLPAAD